MVATCRAASTQFEFGCAAKFCTEQDCDFVEQTSLL
jgi:hypothetical protein